MNVALHRWPSSPDANHFNGVHGGSTLQWGMIEMKNPRIMMGIMRRFSAFVLLAILAMVKLCSAQTHSFEPVEGLSFASGPLTIRQPAIPNRPFTVTGTGGAILGMQDGVVELWQFPLKFFSGLHVSATVDGYSVPIDLTSEAATLDVSPDHTTLTYSHAAITVRQHMFVPAGEGNERKGGVVVFQIESIRPATLTISLTPSMVRQWPAPQYGQPGWDWQAIDRSGAYVISTDNPELFGIIGLPGATSGTIMPYQEHPRTVPLEFRLRFDPRTDSGKMYPLLCEVARPGESKSEESVALLRSRLVSRAANLVADWTQTQAYYSRFFDTRLVVHSPDPMFDKAIAWAELAIDKAQAATPTGEVGLVAGWYPSFDSARPGFGWFFGRDTLWSVYAIDSYGDSELTKRAIDFLVRRQRDDGKMMHEFSQSASLLDGPMSWDRFPYEYAAADSTPLYLLAVRDYLLATGDMSFLKDKWESLKKAFRFERSHDSDGDGIYDNAEGTGWVEGWPPKLPHQEAYLAALDRDATFAMADLAQWEGDDKLSTEARGKGNKLAEQVRKYRFSNGTYAFSKNADGSYDPTQTVYPSVALWGSGENAVDAAAMLSSWSSHVFTTDWGTRAVSENETIYDPISYHQGSVWPLFTGWVSMAEYRAGRPLEGYASLRHNVELTWAQDPGAVTEVLSGRFYEPLGRSSTHQLWSSAMIIAPAIRGMFGVEPDALHHALTLHPQLPASWDKATLDNVRVGHNLFTLSMKRAGAQLEIAAYSKEPTVLCLRGEDVAKVECQERESREHRLNMRLPAVEVQLLEQLPSQFGDSTTAPRIVGERLESRSLTLEVEAMPQSSVRFAVRRNGLSRVSTRDGSLVDDLLTIMFPVNQALETPKSTNHESFVVKTVNLNW